MGAEFELSRTWLPEVRWEKWKDVGQRKHIFYYKTINSGTPTWWL